jgi:hypothetical protein
MPGIPVHIDRPPFSARLVLWGRAGDGWWGLCHWSQTVREHHMLSTAPFAAWLPGASITRPGWSGDGSAEIARITLPTRPTDWPAPAAFSGWFAGVWRSGPVRTPDGVEVENGAAWRRR